MITYPYEHFFADSVSVQTDIVITDGTASYSGTSLVVTGNTVLFTNENIHQEQMSLLETLCSENMLHFGACESAEFKFTISSNVAPLEGKVLKAYLYFDHDASTLFPIGVYKVASDVGTAQKSVREITCYDALYDVLNADYTDWYNAINYTTINTVKKFRDAFFTHIGITQKAVTLVNDSATIVENRAQAISGVQILRAICEINGRFGHIGRTGEFEYVKLEQNIQGLYPAIDLYPSPNLFPQQPKSTPIGRSGEYIPPLKYEEYEVPSITRLQLKTTEDDVGVTVGVAGTDYVIQGNFLTFGSTSLSTIATNILGEISGVVFQPFEVQMNADLCLEVGDAIRCNDDLTGVEGYVLYRQCVGIQAMRDTFNCHAERSYEQNVNNVSFQFKELNNRTLVIKQDVDGILWNLNDQNTGSYAWQTSQEIGAKVDEYYGNQQTGFSWVLTSSGHTWYKDTTEVMKVDENGLTVTGTIKGSTFYCGNVGSETTYIDSQGKEARFANATTKFKDDTVNGDRVITASFADEIVKIEYYPDSQDAGVTIGDSSVTLYDFSVINAEAVQFFETLQSPLPNRYYFCYGEIGANNTILSLGKNIYDNGYTIGTFKADAANINIGCLSASENITIGNTNTYTSTQIKGDSVTVSGATDITLDADTTYIGNNSDVSANPIYIGHSTSGGHTGSYVEINGYQVRLNGTVYINGSSPATISDVDSHYSTTCYYDSQNKYYIKFNLEAFNRLQFYSQHSQTTVTLNDIIQACGL